MASGWRSASTYPTQPHSDKPTPLLAHIEKPVELLEIEMSLPAQYAWLSKEENQ